jgi:hypothetical protein
MRVKRTLTSEERNPDNEKENNESSEKETHQQALSGIVAPQSWQGLEDSGVFISCGFSFSACFAVVFQI